MGSLILKQGIQAPLRICIEDWKKFHAELAYFLIVSLVTKKRAFKSSLDLCFHSFITKFEEKIHTKAVVDVSRGAEERVFLFSLERLGGVCWIACLTCLHARVLACFLCLRACVPTCLACLRATTLGMLACLRACVLECLSACVLTCWACSRVWRACVLTCLACFYVRVLGVLACLLWWNVLLSYVFACLACLALAHSRFCLIIYFVCINQGFVIERKLLIHVNLS